MILHRVTAFDRVIDALAEDLITSTDEELLQAAGDLGMDPSSRGSAAFAGIKYPATWTYSDFFNAIQRPDPLSNDKRKNALPSPPKRGRGKQSDDPQ